MVSSISDDNRVFYLTCGRFIWKHPEIMEENEKIKSLISKCIDGRDFCHENDDVVNQTIDEIMSSNI